MIKLTKEQVQNMHHLLIKETGGVDGLRDFTLLESALAAPFGTFNSQDLFPTIEEKVARLCFGLIKNHPFLDGNKRIGILTMLVLLELNNINIAYTDDDLIQIALALASGNMNENELLLWITKHKTA